MRKVILHYHLFKNAGTSVDELLKTNFGDRWVTQEFAANNPQVNVAQVGQWVASQKEAVAFSSHTAMMPPPEMDGVEFFPIVFVRHPIDRIASAYAFERKQGGDSFGAVLARNTTLAGYIEVRLSLTHDRQCRNFHSTRFSQMFPSDAESEHDKALKAVSALPFVGLVDEFAPSVDRLVAWLSPHFPNMRLVSVAKNVSRDHSITLDEKLAEIEAEVGTALYQQLVEFNRTDMEIYSKVKNLYRNDEEVVA